jgi:hypothetical protein
MTVNYSVHTAQLTQSFASISTKYLMLYSEISAVSSEINTKHINVIHVRWQKVEFFSC